MTDKFEMMTWMNGDIKITDIFGGFESIFKG